MATPLQIVLEELAERLDAGALPTLYEAASVSTAQARQELAAAGLPYTDPAAGRLPGRAELDAAARLLIARAARAATVRGAVGSFGGLATLPPETAAALVQTLRLAQRLAVLYGHDHESDAGRLLLSRALAAAWEVELPADGAWGLRLRHLPEVVRTRLSTGTPASVATVARTVAVHAVVTAGKRVGRIIPGFGTTVGAISARRELRAQGERMRAVYERAWGGDLLVEGEVLDVEEVRR